METIQVKSERAIKFSKVDYGQPFIDNVGSLFMKFVPTCDAEDADNAVNLSTGYGCMFGEDEEVIITDARVVVMNRG